MSLKLKPTELFTNGKIWHPDGAFSEAFGITGKHIDFMGTNIEASQTGNNYQKVTSLGDRLILPGLTDGHLHLVYGSLSRKSLDCSNVNNEAQLQQVIKKYVKDNPGLKYIIGSNLDVGKVFHENAGAGNIADNLEENIPLFITNYDYHSCICNTSCMEKSGLLSKPEMFSDNEIPRNAAGKPAGIAREKAMNYIFDNIPEPGITEKVQAVEEMIAILHSYGITSVSDITDIEDLEVYNELYKAGKLKIRINSYIPFKEFHNLKKYEDYTKEIEPDFFSIRGFKAYYDGALGSETALYSENYKEKPHNGYKTDLVKSGEIFKIAKEIDRAGKQVIIHAIGDQAVTEVLDICEMLEKENGKRDRRFRVEHSQHIKDNDFARFKNLKAIASVQPVHLKYDAHTVKEKLSENLVNHTHNHKGLIDNGVTVNFGTDFPIAGVNPFENMRLAVTRKTVDGVFTPQYKIGLNDCIKCYTINNAFASFNDNTTGTITKGKAADFIIMEDNLFEINKDNIADAKVWKTFFNGEEVYSAS
jgi:predicted amidohydrolase YtcJ